MARRILLVLILSFVCKLTYSQDVEEGNELNSIEAFVKTEVSKKLVHMSDTLTISFVLYTTEVPSRIAKVVYPTSRAFSATELTRSRQKAIEEVDIDGVKYNKITLRKAILTPRSKGKFEFSEGVLILEFDISTGQTVRDFWGNERKVVRRIQKEVEIEAVTITAHDMMIA